MDMTLTDMTPSAWHSNITQDRNEMLDVPAMIDIENNLFFMDQFPSKIYNLEFIGSGQEPSDRMDTLRITRMLRITSNCISVGLLSSKWGN